MSYAPLVDDVGDAALLNTEGLGIYGVAETGGYLVVALQGSWNYRVYTRDPGCLGGRTDERGESPAGTPPEKNVPRGMRPARKEMSSQLSRASSNPRA